MAKNETLRDALGGGPALKALQAFAIALAAVLEAEERGTSMRRTLEIRDETGREVFRAVVGEVAAWDRPGGTGA